MEKEDDGLLGFSVEKMQQDLQIQDTDLNSCMSEQASLYGYYSVLYAKAQLSADRAKNHVEVLKARKNAALRNAKTGRGVKFTEAQLESEVLRSEEVVNAMDKAATTRMRAALIKEALEAFRQRRDMLVQKGKSRLEELKGELYLKGKTDETAMERMKRMQEAIKGSGTDG